MISREQIEAALKDGFAYPCSMCEHLHWARARGIDECRVGHEGGDCGGPLSGLGFPAYQGPLTRESIAKSCFRCGGKANKVVEGNRGPGFVGVCNRHLPVLSRVMEEGDDPWKPIDSHRLADR